MPVYEYICEHCDYRFEEERKVADRMEPVKCPKCGSATTNLVPSLGSFVLKGTGWWGTHDPGSSEYP